jgi:hypothetical protein
MKNHDEGKPECKRSNKLRLPATDMRLAGAFSSLWLDNRQEVKYVLLVHELWETPHIRRFSVSNSP